MEARKNTITIQTIIAVALVIAGAALRLAPHVPNFAPVGAIALFGGAVLGWRLAVWLPLAVMMISDLVLGFYSGIEFTWAGFLLVALFGTQLRGARFLTRVTLGTLGSGIIFFIVSNFGSWLTSGMYEPTLEGLVRCYYMALPFFRTSLLADAFYGVLLFGIYEAASAYIAAHQAKHKLELKHMRNKGYN